MKKTFPKAFPMVSKGGRFGIWLAKSSRLGLMALHTWPKEEFLMAHIQPLEWAAIYAGLNILILLGLAFGTVRARRQHKITLGDGGNPQMQRAMRAHANASEYIPAGIAGITLLALTYPATPLWLLHAVGASLTVGRLAHGIGLSTGELNLGRMLGTILTWTAFVLLGGGLIFAGVAAQY
jgi:uncharacterized membrane protein YecN with MAPEG domain